MKVNKTAMRLYAVTDRTWLNGHTLTEQAEEALTAGVTFLQLREKHLDDAAFLKQAQEIKPLTDRYHVPFVINDNIEVALACNADGVHVGQSDEGAAEVRKKIGAEKILGVSVQTPEQAVRAEQDGADYLGVGSMFSTSTKLDAKPVSYETLQAICKAVSIPVVAIGGITEENVTELSNSGIGGIAVVSAIFAQKDISGAVKRLRKLADGVASQ